MKERNEEAEKMGSRTQASKPVVVEYTCGRDQGGHDDQDTSRVAQVSLRERQHFRIHLQACGQITRELGRTNAESQQSLVDRCTDLQEERRAVEKLQQKGGTSLQRLLLWMRELVMEPNSDGQDQRM